MQKGKESNEVESSWHTEGEKQSNDQGMRNFKCIKIISQNISRILLKRVRNSSPWLIRGEESKKIYFKRSMKFMGIMCSASHTHVFIDRV